MDARRSCCLRWEAGGAPALPFTELGGKFGPDVRSDERTEGGISPPVTRVLLESVHFPPLMSSAKFPSLGSSLLSPLSGCFQLANVA